MDVANAQSIAAGAPAPAVPQRTYARGFGIFAVYFGLYLATLVGTVAPFPLALNIAFSIANGVFIAMVFIVGHDCCHGALVPGPKWNLWLGRVAFLTMLHSVSLWRLAHNKRHHGRTNLKGFDPVWAPMSVREYRAASPARQFLERIYRGALGPILYYHLGIWIPMLLLPVGRLARANWKEHAFNSAFVILGGIAIFLAILVAGHTLAPHRALWVVAVVGWLVPLLVWSYLAAVTTYLNHTHPDIPWFADEESWRSNDGHVRGTAHVRIPLDILPLYSDVMAHPIHHVNPSVPVYALPDEQALLKAKRGSEFKEYVLSVDEYRRIVKACKLYDFERACWTDFSGNPTSARLISG